LKLPFHKYGDLGTNDPLHLRFINVMLKGPLSLILILFLVVRSGH
jgi:hypothetical protein